MHHQIHSGEPRREPERREGCRQGRAMPSARRRALGAALVALCGLLSAPAAAGAATFAPSADARVEQAHPTSNYGTSTTLRVDGGTDPAVETYLRFAVSGLTGPVQRARLRLYTTSGTVVKPVAFGSGATWTEGGLTWSNRPARTLALPTSTGAVSQGTWVEFDATPMVSGDGTYNFVLATSSTDGLNMASRESSSSSSRPQLVVDVAATAPASTTAPAVSGTAQEGQTLSTSNGSWSGSTPLTYAYRWRRCDTSGAACAEIANATSATYTATSADVGFTVRSVVTATNSAGSATAVSSPTATVSAAPAGPVPSAGVGGPVGVPGSGAWFGAWTSSNTGFTVDQREAQIGRKYAIVRRYHGWGEAFPSSQEVTWAQGGRILFFALESRVYGGGVVPWAQIASGAQDATIDAMAARVKALGRPVLMDFMHEPEEWGPVSSNQGYMGTAAEFVAAYRHVVQRFRGDGASNVSWVWTTMGYSGYQSAYPSLYPGDDVVDWIGWDPYNWYSCHNSAWKSFAEKVSGFYSWLQANGHANKPFMLSEYGSRENDLDPLAKGQWFRDALSSLKAGSFPNLKALVYFDSNATGECDWRTDSTLTALNGYAQIGQDPYLNP